MAQLLKEKINKILLHQDAIYEKIQRKNMDVMGPLYKLWESLEIPNKEQHSSLSINDLIKFVTQRIILVGRTNIVLSNRRRLSASEGVIKSTTQEKYILKNNSEIPTLIPREKLPYAQKLVKRLFSLGQLLNVQIVGRLKNFVKKWELLKKDQSTLEILKGYRILFLS